MAAAKRRGMAEFLKEQQALIQGDEGTSPAGPVPGAVPVSAPGSGDPVLISASVVPDPHSPSGPGQLTASEAADLRTCELALDNLRLAFAAAGKALATIRDARLYRATHDTFESYVELRWHMSSSQAYRLIDAWPLAARLSPIGDTITESQVRELLPLAGRHGQDAAVTVYQAVTDLDGVRVTAAVLRDVVSILADDDFDPEAAVRAIRAHLLGEQDRPGRSSADPVQALTSASDRVVRRLHRLASKDPDAVRQALAELRTALDEIEREIT